jgi:hypothetical protein
MSNSQELNPAEFQFVKANADLIAHLPEPGDDWMKQSHPWLSSQELKKLQANNALKRTERIHEYETDAERSGDYRWRWETDARLYQRALKVQERRDAFLECGHAGLVNCGDHFECAFEHCDREFDRSEVRT